MPRLSNFRTLSFFVLALTFITPADAMNVRPGDKVLAQGKFKRKCSAQVEALSGPSQVKLKFDQNGCGDESLAYSVKALQQLETVSQARAGGKLLKAGDPVVVKGFLSASCSGKVRELTKNGFVSIEFDSRFCADTDALYPLAGVTKVSFVEEGRFGSKVMRVGQLVSTKGIHETEVCKGRIQKLTDNGFAVVAFEQLTCANGGKLYSLEKLNPLRSAKARKLSGEAIFQEVMREIASSRP